MKKRNNITHRVFASVDIRGQIHAAIGSKLGRLESTTALLVRESESNWFVYFRDGTVFLAAPYGCEKGVSMPAALFFALLRDLDRTDDITHA